jgi:hypothetical protein
VLPRAVFPQKKMIANSCPAYAGAAPDWYAEGRSSTMQHCI